VCSWISVCVLGPQRHGAIVEDARCCVSQFFLFCEKSPKIASRAARKESYSCFFLLSSILSVPKLTLVLSCRGYHLPDLIRERNTGKIHNLSPRYFTLPYHCNHASQVEEFPQRLSIPSFSHTTVPLRPPRPPHRPRHTMGLC
jgi:hypothetical protein